MAAPPGFDVLVIGSGASGLAAAVSAERAGARVAVAAKGSLQSCNSAKAQGGIQAAFGEDDSPEQHAAGRLGVEPRDRRHAARRGADRRRAVGDPLARGARRRVHARERRLPPRALRRRDAQAAAAGRRPHRPRDHEGPARRVGGRARARRSSTRRSASLEPTENGWRARCGEHEIDADDRRPRPPAGAATACAGARRALDQPSRRDRRGDRDRARPRRRGARPRRAAVPPERRRLAGERCRATRSPRRRAPTAPCS